MRTSAAPIAVALDAPDAQTMVSWAKQVGGFVSHLKVGLEVYLRDGAPAVHAVRDASPQTDLFLDLKLHDIPATVAGAARSVAHLEPAILTVHAAGGSAMVQAACNALPNTLVAGVTILTSLSEADLARIGFAGNPEECVTRLATLAVDAGARAIVCSAAEVSLVRAAVGPGVLLITPGIRPADSSADDQARVATPASALAAGADLLVIGRPITAAADPAAAAEAIAESIRN